jgi:hypothetical protein
MASFLDQFMLKDKCFMVVYEYANLTILCVIEIYVFCMLCEIMFKSDHGHLVTMNFC